MTIQHKLTYLISGILGAILVWLPANAHTILPLIPAHYQAVFSATVAFIVTIGALKSTPPEQKQSQPSQPPQPKQ